MFAAIILWLQLFTVIMSTPVPMANATATVNSTEFLTLVSDFVTSLDLTADVAATITSKYESDPALKELLSTSDNFIAEENTFVAEEKRDLKSALDALIQFTVKLVFGPDALTDDASISSIIDASWTQTCWLKPAIVIRPETATDVSRVLKVATFLRIPFAVRSGGHSPNPGFASIEDYGILIDLVRLDKTTISKDHKVASVGPGARWGEVVAALDPYDVTVSAGRAPEVGVGGLILGGGVSHFTPEYGLVADTLTNVEIVLADGSIVNANPTQRSDLFWALKGGGPNFGIVTRFDLKTLPIKKIWFQSTLYAPNQANAILDAFAKFQANGDPKASVIVSLTPTFGTVALVYSAPVANPPAFAAFSSIPVLQAALPGTLGTVLQLNQIIASLNTAPPARHDYRGTSTKVDAGLYKDVFAFWNTKAATVSAATHSNATFVPQHIPKSAIDAGNKAGGNPLGLQPINQMWWTTIMDWTKASDDDKVRSIGIETTAKFSTLGKAKGSYLPFIYMNDASRDQNPLALYPAANIAKLKTIAKKYDPEGVFQKLQNDGFLLSNI